MDGPRRQHPRHAELIEACCINGVKKLVFASSNAVYGYGPGLTGDLVETTPFHYLRRAPAAILYGASKIIGEQLCRDAFLKRGLDYVVVRYSTVYGERQHYRAANALYIIETHDRVRQGQRPRVIGDGSETKHFVHVSDVARANAAAFAADATNVAVNIRGRSPPPRWRSCASSRSCRARSWRPSTSGPSRQGAPDLRRRLAVDHALAERTIGWRPRSICAKASGGCSPGATRRGSDRCGAGRPEWPSRRDRRAVGAVGAFAQDHQGLRWTGGTIRRVRLAGRRLQHHFLVKMTSWKPGGFFAAALWVFHEQEIQQAEDDGQHRAENECRWPIGDPREAGFHFCGERQADGRPYCAQHWAMAFVPSRPRYSQAAAQAVAPLVPARRPLDA